MILARIDDAHNVDATAFQARHALFDIGERDAPVGGAGEDEDRPVRPLPVKGGIIHDSRRQHRREKNEAAPCKKMRAGNGSPVGWWGTYR